ncbi:growth hormone secretagogue receptor type 1-like [Elysia marginata]|uniref:Growth hormone secretagogue receptor type 1-like n=1 Tax=Elysia marginata TaxID=1093978 RepID=A0AAV4F8B1_9GAST|nr:growth hormone secretagogue receptor type 1-like [Elysia marginata]
MCDSSLAALEGKLVIFLENTVTVTSILIILTVSLERFWAVYYPLKTYSSGSKSRAMVIMAGVWLVSALVTVPFLVMAETYQTTRHADGAIVDVCHTPEPDTALHKGYIVTRFTLIFAIPLVLLAGLYTLIIHKVLSETMECKQMTETARSQSAQNRKQLVIMLVGIIVLFFVCLLPFRVLTLSLTFADFNVMQKMGVERYLNFLWFCRLLIYINSAGNPIIYNIFSTKFRRAFQKVLRMYCCCCKKRLAMVGLRHHSNGTQIGTRMTTMSQYTHYSMVRPEASDSVDNV